MMIPTLMTILFRSEANGFTLRQRLLLILAFFLGMAMAAVVRGCPYWGN
jgi:hypothetical protein